MTTQQPARVVQPAAGSRLDQLASQYDAAKLEATAAAERLKQITDAIKVELYQAVADGVTKVDLMHRHGLPLRMSARTSWRLDTPRFKREQPQVYAAYAKPVTTWELRAIVDKEVG